VAARTLKPTAAITDFIFNISTPGSGSSKVKGSGI
jgi:hypothetical protein